MRVLWVQGYALVADLPATAGSHGSKEPRPVSRSCYILATIRYSSCHNRVQFVPLFHPRPSYEMEQNGT